MTTTLFDLAATVLENGSELDRLEARGTLRIALRSAGLDARSVDLEQLRVVFAKVMPDELEKRGVSGGVGVASSLWTEIERAAAPLGSRPATNVDATFRRLAGD